MTEVFTWEGFKDYVTSPNEVFSNDIVAKLVTLLRELLSSTIQLTKSTIILIGYILVIGVKLSVIVFPYLSKATNAIIEFHRTQLTIREIIGEVVFLILIILYFTFRKSIIKFLKNVQSSINKKSKAVGRVAPHILLLVSSISFCILFHKFLKPLSTLSVLPVFTLLFPLINTIRLRYWMPIDYNKYRHYRHILNMWIILGLYHAIATSTSYMPFSNRVLHCVTTMRQFIVILSLWILLSPDSTYLMIDLVDPLKKYVSNILPLIQLPPMQSNTIFTTLHTFGIISVTQSNFCMHCFQDGAALAFAIIFILTPFPGIGMIIVSFLFPIFKTSRACEELCVDDNSLNTTSNKGQVAPKGKNKLLMNNQSISTTTALTTTTSTATKKTTTTSNTNSSSSNSNAVVTQTPKKSTTSNTAAVENTPFSPFAKLASWVKRDKISEEEANILKQTLEENKNIMIRQDRERWIDYWICYSVILLYHLYMMKIWIIIMILLTLWMQHTYFKGASQMIQYMIQIYTGFKHRNLALQQKLIEKNNTTNTTTTTTTSDNDTNDGNSNDNSKECDLQREILFTSPLPPPSKKSKLHNNIHEDIDSHNQSTSSNSLSAEMGVIHEDKDPSTVDNITNNVISSTTTRNTRSMNKMKRLSSSIDPSNLNINENNMKDDTTTTISSSADVATTTTTTTAAVTTNDDDDEEDETDYVHIQSSPLVLKRKTTTKKTKTPTK